VILPGIALTLMVVGFNLLGESIALSKSPKPLSARALGRAKALFAREAVA
jgi:hypothetical protein